MSWDKRRRNEANKELFERANQGCDESLEELVENFGPLITQQVRKAVNGAAEGDLAILAERDLAILVADSKAHVIEKFPDMDGVYPQLSSWISTCTRRRAMRTARREFGHQEVPWNPAWMEGAVENPSGDSPVSDEVEINEQKEALTKCLAQLEKDRSHEYRAVWLHYSENWTDEEIRSFQADQHNDHVSAAAIQKRRAAAMKRIATCLRGQVER